MIESGPGNTAGPHERGWNMAEGKDISAYEISVEALNQAQRVGYQEDVSTLLSTADKIRAWLIATGDFTVLGEAKADTESAETNYMYFSDELRKDDGTFPSYSYWYRFNRADKTISVMRERGAERRDETEDLEEVDKNDPVALMDNWGLSPATVSEVPEWAR